MPFPNLSPNKIWANIKKALRPSCSRVQNTASTDGMRSSSTKNYFGSINSDKINNTTTPRATAPRATTPRAQREREVNENAGNTRNAQRAYTKINTKNLHEALLFLFPSNQHYTNQPKNTKTTDSVLKLVKMLDITPQGKNSHKDINNIKHLLSEYTNHFTKGNAVKFDDVKNKLLESFTSLKSNLIKENLSSPSKNTASTEALITQIDKTLGLITRDDANNKIRRTETQAKDTFNKGTDDRCKALNKLLEYVASHDTSNTVSRDIFHPLFALSKLKEHANKNTKSLINTIENTLRDFASHPEPNSHRGITTLKNLENQLNQLNINLNKDDKLNPTLKKYLNTESKNALNTLSKLLDTFVTDKEEIDKATSNIFYHPNRPKEPYPAVSNLFSRNYMDSRTQDTVSRRVKLLKKLLSNTRLIPNNTHVARTAQALINALEGLDQHSSNDIDQARDDITAHIKRLSQDLKQNTSLRPIVKHHLLFETKKILNTIHNYNANKQYSNYSRTSHKPKNDFATSDRARSTAQTANQKMPNTVLHILKVVEDALKNAKTDKDHYTFDGAHQLKNNEKIIDKFGFNIPDPDKDRLDVKVIAESIKPGNQLKLMYYKASEKTAYIFEMKHHADLKLASDAIANFQGCATDTLLSPKMKGLFKRINQ
ncbi:MAG: hypothetical protein P8144_04840 [Gammaproteobacteria bacterium]